MGIEIIPTGSALGAEIRGVRLGHLGTALAADIRTAWHRHLVLLFRDQDISDGDQVAFSRLFGDLDPAPFNKAGRPWIPEHPELSIISNIERDGKPIGALGAGEAIWHSDMSDKEKPPSASVLRAVEVPPSGGDTWFASMVRAYEKLRPEMQARIASLAIKHDASINSGGEQRKGFDVVTDPRDAPGAVHPIVRTHPGSGERCLFLGRRRNAYVMGLPLAESEALLDELWQHATHPDFVWRHQWRAGDVLMWDNRAVIHRRDEFDPSSRRLMHRTQVKGQRPE